MGGVVFVGNGGGKGGIAPDDDDDDDDDDDVVVVVAFKDKESIAGSLVENCSKEGFAFD